MLWFLTGFTARGKALLAAVRPSVCIHWNTGRCSKWVGLERNGDHCCRGGIRMEWYPLLKGRELDWTGIDGCWMCVLTSVSPSLRPWNVLSGHFLNLFWGYLRILFLSHHSIKSVHRIITADALNVNLAAQSRRQIIKVAKVKELSCHGNQNWAFSSSLRFWLWDTVFSIGSSSDGFPGLLSCSKVQAVAVVGIWILFLQHVIQELGLISLTPVLKNHSEYN